MTEHNTPNPDEVYIEFPSYPPGTSWREVFAKDGVELPTGPWDDEPDREVWVDEATGLDCLLKRNWNGAICGYVGVRPSHPFYGMDREDAQGWLAVHDGITYSASCDGDVEYGICHVPREGDIDEVWWFGFAGMNWRDIIPGHLAAFRHINIQTPALGPMQTYPTWAYMQAEVKSLALQLAALGSLPKTRLWGRDVETVEGL